MTPLALTHAQLVIVMSGAHQVPVEYRDRYLQSIADQLTGIDVNDNAVQRAVSVTVQRMSSKEMTA